MPAATTPLERLAAFAVGTPVGAVPPAVSRAAGVLLLDALGTALANRDTPFVRAIRAVVERDGAGGPCTPIGAAAGAPGLPIEAAAELDSSAIHGSDLDATHIASIIHPTAVAVPVALTVGEAVDATGREVLAALALGMEVLIRLGLAAGGRFHVRGYQPTALLGPVVAAFVAARLQGRSADHAVQAAGLATAVAAGLRSFSDDGTWGKRLITGWACRTGIHAEALTAAGFTGSPDALEKRWGLFPAFLPDGGFDLDLALDGLGETWVVPETEPKRYPCSHGLHPFIESALALRDRVALDDIVQVECRVNEEAARWWFEPAAVRYRPDAYGARFSIPYVVARALLDGRVEDAAFEPDAVVDPRVLALVDRVRPVRDPSLEGRPPVGLPGAVRIVRRDATPVSLAAAPPSDDAERFVIERFRATAGRALGPGRAEDLESVVLDLAAQPSIRPVLRLTTVRDGAEQASGRPG